MSQDPFHSYADELGILGCAMQDSVDAATEAVEAVNVGIIANEAIAESLRVVDTILQKNESPNLMTMGKAWAKVHRTAAPIELWSQAIDSVPSAANVGYYVEGARTAALRRKLKEAAAFLGAEAADSTKPLDVIIANLEGRISIDASTTPTVHGSVDIVRDLIDDIEARAKRRGQLSGVTTGFRMLDMMTDGIQFGELFLVGARPSIGKTAFGTTLVLNACINGKVPTLFVSCEMSKRSIMRRIVSGVAEVPMGDIKRGELEEPTYKTMVRAVAKVSNAPLYMFEAMNGESVATIVTAIRRAVRRHGVKLVIVDYLQRIRASGSYEKRTYEVGEVSGKLKAVASATGVALVCLAQLNRESEKDKGRVPRLTDLAESGQIERDADTVVLLNRDRSLPRGEAQFVVAKQRDGECGAVHVWYEGQYCKFEDCRGKPE